MSSTTPDTHSRLLTGAAIGLALLFSFTGIFGHGLWTPDEPRVAEIGRAMLTSGDFTVPALAGKPFLEKPPLYWWAMSLSYGLFGISPGTARLTSALFGFFTLLLAFAMARRIGGGWAGLLAVCVTATTVNARHLHRIVTDPALACFVALGYWAFVSAAFRSGKGRPPGGWVLLVYLAGGLAFLSKGIVGPGVLFGPIGLYVVGARRWDLLRLPVHLPGLALLLLLCAAWPVMLAIRGGRPLLDGFLVDNILYRFLPSGDGIDMGGHKKPIWFYLVNLPWVLLPWSLVLPSLFRHLIRSSRLRDAVSGELLFVSLVMPLGVLLLSLAGTKRSLYLLPLLAPMGASLGAWLAAGGLDPGRGRWSTVPRRALLGIALGVCAVSGLALTLVFAGLVPMSDLTAKIMARSSGSPWAAAGAVVLFATLGIVAWRRRHRRSVFGSALFALGATILVLNVAGFRIVDPAKDLRPFVMDVAASGARDPELVGYLLDETTRALLPFYGGFTVPDIRSQKDLRDRLRRNWRTKVIMLERRKSKLPASVRNQARPVLRWASRGRRSYVILKLEEPLEP